MLHLNWGTALKGLLCLIAANAIVVYLLLTQSHIP